MSYLQELSDIQLLALLIAAEAGNQSLDGQVSVACVPIERLRRRRWGSNLRAVILQPYQFSTFNDIHWERFTKDIPAFSTLAELAIERLLNSRTPGATHYCRHDLAPMPKWTQTQFSDCLGRIGDHVFYREG